MNNSNYYIASFSGGKDSTAMVLHLIELNEPLDEVIFCDTYKEFPDMYEHIDKIKQFISNKGIKWTELKNERSYDYFMFEHNVKRKTDSDKNTCGYSWASPKVRWCTSILKTQIIEKYLSELYKTKSVVQYVGIAADETHRLERKANQLHKHPLVDWGWSESDCLQYCYSHGYNWGGFMNDLSVYHVGVVL